MRCHPVATTKARRHEDIAEEAIAVLNHRGTETQSHRKEKPQITQMNADFIADRTDRTRMYTD